MEILPDTHIMLVVAVVFFATMFFLNKYVFEPVISLMDKREQKINEDLKSVSNDDVELAKLEEEAQMILKNAKAEAYAIVEAEVARAKEVAQAKIEKTTFENKEKFDSFLIRLYAHREEMKSELREHLKEARPAILAKMKNL